MNTTYNAINFNVNLLDETRNASDEKLLNYHVSKLEQLAKLLNTEKFAENYPKQLLEECQTPANKPTRGQVKQSCDDLWGKIWSDYILASGRRLARFTIDYEDLIAVRHIDERDSWQKIVAILAGWERTPHMPNVYAELIPME